MAATDSFQLFALIEVGRDYRDRLRGDSGIVFEDGYGTVDKVLHPERFEFYSTKPPLLTVLAAGEYWVLKKAFGWSLKEKPFEVVRVILLTFNVLPLALYLWLLARLLDHYAAADWSRYFVLGAAAFGTMVTPFLISFNNHTLGTCAALVAVYAALRVWSGANSAWWYAAAGLAAGFLVTCELPAAALAAALFGMLWWRSPQQTLLAFVPAAAVPVAALLLTNYHFFHEWLPPYFKFGGPWYEYEGSHWLNVARGTGRGIDTAGRHETKAVYALHLLVGHHGIFSLTPMFLLTIIGLVIGVCSFSRDPKGSADAAALPFGSRLNEQTPLPRVFFAVTLVVSLIVLGFYLLKSDNYGGWSNGPRWLMWLAPLWLLAALPALDWFAVRRWGRGLALVLLALSVLSAHYGPWNPWRHPWIYNYLDDRGLISYDHPIAAP